MGGLHEELQAKSAQRARRKRLETLLTHAEQDLVDLRQRLSQLTEQLAAEEQDVARLEGLSLTALFHTILSSKQEQLEKEKQEFLQAKLRYDECRASVTELEHQVDGLRRELQGLEDVEADYERLLREKEAQLARDPHGSGAQILELATRLGVEEQQRVELDEALSCGYEVQAALARMVRELRSAENWGTWDLLGGGLLSTAIKHSKIDAGRTAAHEAQALLRRFQHELADVRQRAEVSIEVGGFNTFADFFFDGLIFDWVVQSKIQRSLEGAVQAHARVGETVAALRDMLLVADQRIAALEEERRGAIERA